MKKGTLVVYTKLSGSKVETRATGDSFEFRRGFENSPFFIGPVTHSINIPGETLPVPMDRVKENPRFPAAKEFYSKFR